MYSFKSIKYFIGRLEMIHSWWCMDCRTGVELDVHGRCATCESEAVDPSRSDSFELSTVPMAEISATDLISCS